MSGEDVVGGVDGLDIGLCVGGMLLGWLGFDVVVWCCGCRGCTDRGAGLVVNVAVVSFVVSCCRSVFRGHG